MYVTYSRTVPPLVGLGQMLCMSCVCIIRFGCTETNRTSLVVRRTSLAKSVKHQSNINRVLKHSEHERFVQLGQSTTTRNMDLSATLALAGIILAILWFRGKKKQNLPPGPFALPLIGNLPLLEKKAPFKSFTEVSSAFMCICFWHLSGHKASWLTRLPTTTTAEQNLRSCDDFTSGLAANCRSGGIWCSERGSSWPGGRLHRPRTTALPDESYWRLWYQQSSYLTFLWFLKILAQMSPTCIYLSLRFGRK